MAESTSNSKREWSQTIGAIAVIVLMLLMFVVLVMLLGAVRGEEFSPMTFARRSFVFYRIPLLKIQITPVLRTPVTNALESHLANKLFPRIISPEAGPAPDHGQPEGRTAIEPRWDVVFVAPMSRPSKAGSADCLCAYLDRTEGGNLKWLRWTQAHPPLAKALWPVVRRAAIDRLYFSIPDLMSAAEQATKRGTDTTGLQIELARIVEEAATLRDRATATDKKPNPIQSESS